MLLKKFTGCSDTKSLVKNAAAEFPLISISAADVIGSDSSRPFMGQVRPRFTVISFVSPGTRSKKLSENFAPLILFLMNTGTVNHDGVEGD